MACRPHVVAALTAAACACLFSATIGAGSAQAQPTPMAKNVIFMIADGCGFNHILATDYFHYGETGRQVYQSFPVRMAMSTFPIGGSYDPAKAAGDFGYRRQGPTDSAAAATAMSTGHKTYNAAIGVVADAGAAGQNAVDAEVDPANVVVKKVEHMSERAEKLGKATGVVTTVQISHATPAGFVAHNRTRNDYVGIAKEMVLESAAEVIIGAGHPLFDDNGRLREYPAGEKEIEARYKYVGGIDTWRKIVDGQAGADCDGDGVPDPWTLIQSLDGFANLHQGDTPKRLLGIAACHQTFQQRRGGPAGADPHETPTNQTVPLLAQATRAALNVLDNDPDGLFLMIEGGAVDWAGHENNAGRMIEEQLDFNEAVDAVVEWVEEHSSWEETLVIVTADHETGYLTGPKTDTGTAPDVVNNGEGNLPGLAWNSGNHTNSLVPFYAKGPFADLIAARATGTDPARGAYLDNTVPAQVVLEMWK